jgi:hypothetical protein
MKIRELLSDESKWTQWANARDAQGNQCGPYNPVAVRWCLFGAFLKCYGYSATDFDRSRFELARQVLDKIACKVHMAFWNDEPSTSFADVKSLVETLDV